MRIVFAIVLVVCGSAGRVSAADPPVGDLAVDQVTQKHGPRLLGAVVDRSPDGTLTVAVSRSWLKAASPRYFEEYREAEAAQRREALEELRDRLKRWQAERPEPKTLAFFLAKETERTARELKRTDEPRADEPEPEFLLVTVNAANVERVFVQPAPRKQVAVVAWKEGLARVESRSAGSLTKELEQRKIDLAAQRVDLSDRFPIRRQSADEWSARQAIVEYQLRQAIDFQGAGDIVLRTGDRSGGALTADLIVGILRSQLEGQLADLLNDGGGRRPSPKAESDAWLKKAASAADDAEAVGFRVSRVTTDVAAGSARVETRFVAKLSNGKWKTVWSHSDEQNAAKSDPDVVDRIAKDPQVKRTVDLLESSGLVGGGDAVRQALRFGAATMQAQQAADEWFLEFRDRYLQHLDGPLLPLPPG